MCLEYGVRVKAYISTGEIGVAIRLLRDEVPYPEERRDVIMGWIELAQETVQSEYLDQARQLTAALPPEASLLPWALIYQMSGRKEDLDQAYGAVQMKSLPEKQQAKRWMNLIRAHVHRGEIAEARNLLLQVVNPNARCSALALIAEKSNESKDLVALLQHIDEHMLQFEDLGLVRDIVRVCLAYTQVKAAMAVAEKCGGALQLAALSLIASNTNGATQSKALMRVEKMVMSRAVAGNYYPYACVDAVRALAANGKLTWTPYSRHKGRNQLG